LLAENPSTAAKMNILDSCVRNCNTRELARHIAQPWIMTSKSSRYANTNHRKPRGIAASGLPCRTPRRLSAGSFRSARAVVVGASTKMAVISGGLHLHTGISQMSRFVAGLSLSRGCDAMDLSARCRITASFANGGRTCSGRIRAGHEASREIASGGKSKDALMAAMMECADVTAQGRRLRKCPVRLPFPRQVVIRGPCSPTVATTAG